MRRFVHLIAVVLLFVVLLWGAVPVAAAPIDSVGWGRTFVNQLVHWLWPWGNPDAIDAASGTEVPIPAAPTEPATTDTTSIATPPDDGSTTETHPMGDPDG